MSSEVVLEFIDVSMKYDDNILFENLSFSLHENETIGITGPSGSGKSTLLRIANNLEDPASGNVLFQGKDVTEWEPTELRSCMILVPQQASMFPGTVRKNLLWGLKIHNRSAADEELRKVLDEVNLDPDMIDRTGENLSGGEKQRIAIARALLLEPCVLLLDEPTSALDEKSTLAVESTINDIIKQRQIGVLIVTHSREQSERFTERVIELEMR
ncbi:MAG: ATP-binding cassette domain-containing protein [Candidatus Thorarchaeota archaeon]|nr:ATP-binding cassette domain-containing protein [Candidatus Thorarchaeota archaeon]